MIILNNISKSFGDKTLFNNINMTIYDGEKIGIIGINGSGKSTFMNLIANIIEPDLGSVKIHGTYSYVKQIAESIDSKHNLNEDLIKFQKINTELNLEDKLYQDFSSLSGGEQTKLNISYALSKNTDILLLDEPTNNLSQEGIEWLINKLNQFKGTVITISHDRYFLDNFANKILEFENGNITEFYGNYSDYEKQKQENLNYEKKVYQEKIEENRKLKKQIYKINEQTQKLEASSKRDGSSDKRAKGFKDSVQNKVKKLAKQAEAKKSRLERLEKNVGDKPFEYKDIFYKIKPEQTHSKLLIKLTNVKKQFKNRILFDNVNLSITNGEKTALIGDNGSGKTTLIKMILGEENYNGDIWKSKTLKIAYLPQNTFSLASTQTIIEIANEFGDLKTQFLTNLRNMGIDRELFDKKLSTLSSGEKMKVKLNELILSDFNFLILDEPTNNLDINNKKFLETVLKKYNGNLLIVSHDKTLLKNICTSKINIENNQIKISNIDS